MADSWWLNGKTCIVTGASGGIGAGIAATLIKQHNCKVIGIARSEPKMLKFIDELGPDYAQNFTYKLFDVSKKENWDSFYASLVEDGTQVDILINNAGILPKFKRFDRYSMDEIEAAININFYSAVYSIKAFLPMLIARHGAIFNIDSSAALMSLAGTSMYSASKAALKGFTESLREDLRGKVFVGLVCPGFTKTDIMRGQSNEGGQGQKIIDMISTDCDKMVKMIMYGIAHKHQLQVHGMDAHAMNIANKLMPVDGTRIFSAVMRLAHIDLFKDVFDDDD